MIAGVKSPIRGVQKQAQQRPCSGRGVAGAFLGGKWCLERVARMRNHEEASEDSGRENSV